MKVVSEITGELADCTICTGIELPSGERIGAIADIDCFDMFSVDMYDAIDGINKREGTNIPLPKMGSQLWELESKGRKIPGMKCRKGATARFEKGNAKTDLSKGELLQKYIAQGGAFFPDDEE